MAYYKTGEVKLVPTLKNIHTYDNDYSKDSAELLAHNWKLEGGKP